MYLKDSYLKDFAAKVVSVKESKIFLDKTAFYPVGGGQPTDTGKIFINSKKFDVLNVKKEGNEVWHKLNDTAGIEKGLEIKGKIDWKKRYKIMRMHTSAHVLAAIIFKQTKKMITGNQIGAEVSRMDFNADKSFETESAKKLQETVNQELLNFHDVTVSFLPREEALKLSELVRLKDIMPPNLLKWRIVKIGGIDLQADGGTHVKNTSEIGQIEITKTQNKGSNNKRIYWKLKK